MTLRYFVLEIKKNNTDVKLSNNFNYLYIVIYVTVRYLLNYMSHECTQCDSEQIVFIILNVQNASAYVHTIGYTMYHVFFYCSVIRLNVIIINSFTINEFFLLGLSIRFFSNKTLSFH